MAIPALQRHAGVAGVALELFLRLLQDYTGIDGYGQILGALGVGWRQFPHGYDIPSAGAVAAFIYTFRSNLVSETMWGITRGHQTARYSVHNSRSLNAPRSRC